MHASPDYRVTGARLVTAPPASDGYCFPAEWRRHERTLMQFLPRSDAYSRDADTEWAAVANAVADFEPVTMAVHPDSAARARALLSGDIERIEWPIDDGWCRDSGPMVLVNGCARRRVAGFSFNGWGGKFSCGEDALVKARFARHLDFDFHPLDLVLEGGAVHLDGEGTLLTTAQCLLHDNRNPGRSQAQIETMLKDSLGVSKIIWLARGLAPDPITDGHVDGIAAFAAPAVVLVHTTQDRGSPNCAITAAARETLRQATDARGRRLEVIELPLTGPDLVHMNFYICNGAVIVPVAGNRRADERPLAILRETFPDHRIVPVGGRLIACGGGGVHCITQQVPAL